MLQNTIKAGAITHLTDARFFASYDVAYIGFCFDQSSVNYIAPDRALAIRGWISGPAFVAEVAGADVENVRNILEYFQPDAVQVNIGDLTELRETLLNSGLPIFLRMSDYQGILLPDESIQYYIFPAGVELPQEIAPSSIMIEVNTTMALEAYPPGLALHISGSPEQETGVKSYDELATFFETRMLT